MSSATPSKTVDRSSESHPFKVGDHVRVLAVHGLSKNLIGTTGYITETHQKCKYGVGLRSAIYIDSIWGHFNDSELELIEAAREFDITNCRFGGPSRLDDFDAEVGNVFAEAQELLLRKHKDYGPGNIALAPGGPLNGLRVRLHDKFARIDHLAATGVRPQNESVRDSYLDALNYCAIALLVIDGDWPTA